MPDKIKKAEQAVANKKVSRIPKELKSIVFTPAGVAASRMAICSDCEFFTPKKFCKKCKCFMPGKVKLSGSFCPENKWGKFVKPLKRPV